MEAFLLLLNQIAILFRIMAHNVRDFLRNRTYYTSQPLRTAILLWQYIHRKKADRLFR
jgi:hypothetical protein